MELVLIKPGVHIVVNSHTQRDTVLRLGAMALIGTLVYAFLGEQFFDLFHVVLANGMLHWVLDQVQLLLILPLLLIVDSGQVHQISVDASLQVHLRLFVGHVPQMLELGVDPVEQVLQLVHFEI